MLPNFLVVGAQRCATGWIAVCLREHPDIFMARDETRFFDLHQARGLEWWAREYFAAHRDERMVGEKTAEYLYGAETPATIRRDLGPIKVVCCLRHPVDRFHSAYRFQVRRHGLRRPLEELVHEESDLVWKGRYAEPLERYWRVFSRDNVLAMLYEDKLADPLAFMATIYRFLGVEPGYRPPSAAIQVKPGAFEHRGPLRFWLTRWLTWRSPLRPLYSRLRPAREPVRLPPAELGRLLELFLPDTERLEAMLGRDLSAWKRAEPASAREPRQ